MRPIDADSVKRGIEELKQSPWYNEKNLDHFPIRKEAVEVVEHLCIDKEPTIEPLTEIDYIELADRYGGEVAFVVKDMIEQTGRRWGNEEPPKIDDVVKVVRCKDCKVRNEERCPWWHGVPSDKFYCAWGERRNDDKR